IFFTTCTSTSRPTISAVRNVADFGQPTAGPVHASTSSTVIPSVPIRRSALSIENVPMRLAMKFGESFAITTPLPSLLSQKSLSVSTTSFEVFGPGMTSTNLRYRAGLSKLRHACQQVSFDFQIFRDHFDDPVRFRATREIIFKVSNRDFFRK